jgi:hypothetical protein
VSDANSIIDQQAFKQYSPLPRIRRKASSGFSLLGRRPPDEDEQLVAARFELTRLETQYIEAAKAVDKLSQFRKGVYEWLATYNQILKLNMYNSNVICPC